MQFAMTYNQLYLPASIPQWGIFLGIVCVIIGYIEKKEWWMTAGWIILITTGLTSLAFNLFGGLSIHPIGNVSDSAVTALMATGWQCATGGALSAAALIFQRMKNRYFKFLAILTVLYFMLIFFQFNQLMLSQSMVTKPVDQTEQGK
jgi:hypothetical protein